MTPEEKWQHFLNTHRKNIVPENGTDAYAKLKGVILNGEPTPETVIFGSHRIKFTRAELNSAYRKLSLAVHPDRNRDRAEEAEAMFKVINEANKLLDNKLRKLGL
jgi:hypothetical protein